MSEKISKNHDFSDLRTAGRKVMRINFFLILTGAFLFLFLCCMDLYQKRQWDKKISEYDHVQGIITKNQRVRKKSGKSTKTVSVIEYRFKYKNSEYYGSRIVYGETYFPPKKVGSKHTIIVNPDNPTESAAMIFYGRQFLKYGTAIWTFGLFAVLLFAAFMQFPFKTPPVPQKMLDYINSFPPEEIERLQQRNFEFAPQSKYVLRGNLKYSYQRYIRITNSFYGSFNFALLAIIIVNLSAVIIARAYFALIFVAILVLIVFLTRPFYVFFDMIEKRFGSSSKSNPVSVKEYHDFSDVVSLCIKQVSYHKSGPHFALFALKNDDSTVFITQVRPRKLVKLFNTAYDLVQIIGKIPIIAK